MEADRDREAVTHEIELSFKVVDVYRIISQLFWSELKLVSKYFDNMSSIYQYDPA